MRQGSSTALIRLSLVSVQLKHADLSGCLHKRNEWQPAPFTLIPQRLKERASVFINWRGIKISYDIFQSLLHSGMRSIALPTRLFVTFTCLTWKQWEPLMVFQKSFLCLWKWRNLRHYIDLLMCLEQHSTRPTFVLLCSKKPKRVYVFSPMVHLF